MMKYKPLLPNTSPRGISARDNEATLVSGLRLLAVSRTVFEESNPWEYRMNEVFCCPELLTRSPIPEVPSTSVRSETLRKLLA